MNIAPYVLSFTALLAGAAPALACPADLDAGFAGGGIATSLAPGSAYDVEVDGEGRILTAGFAGTQPSVTRFLPDGAIDESFGEGGIARLDGVGALYSVVPLPDGTIVAAGDVIAGDGPSQIGSIVARFLESGELDTGFGTGGVTITLPGPTTFVRDLLVRSDGVIVVIGQVTGSAFGWQPLALFYTSEGVLDEAKGPPSSDGIVTVGAFDEFAVATSAVEVDDRAIVFSGILADLSRGDGFLVKLTSDGLPDAGFGRAGQRIYRSPRKYEEGWRIARDDEGRLYVSGDMTGTAHLSHTRLFVRRVLPDGRRDGTYGRDGRAVLRFRRELAPRGLAVTGSGEAVVPAWFVYGSGSIVARLTPAGERDASFGRNGVARFRLGDDQTELHQVAVQDDGRILASGRADTAPLVLRLEGGAGDESCSAD
jgi:uncharacterized delta-60 repeat protein